MTKFSANLGFLWTELSLVDAIHAAKKAGFDAVECHMPYDTPPGDVKAALTATGMIMLGINTIRGKEGDNGLSALQGREDEALAAIDQAITYAAALGTPNIHVMAGLAQGDEAHKTFTTNLAYACAQAASHGITILIEPLNRYDAPGYFLQTAMQAKSIIDEMGVPNLKLMFDCYHLQITGGDICRNVSYLMPIIGHIQFASVPGRNEPDIGELNYKHIFQHLDALGYTAPLGAEYKPQADTQSGLGWMHSLTG